jgi:predicted GH43/DUF377 family glycosyl hydrolase
VFEDPRVQVVVSRGTPRFVLTYTHVSARLAGTPWRAALSELTFNAGAFSLGRELLLGPEQVSNKNVVLCNLHDGRIALFQRLEPPTSSQQSIQIATFASIEDLQEPPPDFWRRYMEKVGEHIILTPSAGACGIGAGAPPVLVGGELVFFYHERDRANVYTTRVALLDPDTARVRGLLRYPILTPELPWERNGDVNNVVFVQGAQVRDDGTIYLTYGAADRHIGAASIETAPLLAALHTGATNIRSLI